MRGGSASDVCQEQEGHGLRVKDCPSPVKIKNAEKLDVSDLLQKVKERSLLK